MGTTMGALTLRSHIQCNYKDTNERKTMHGNCSHGVGLSMKASIASQTIYSVKMDIAPCGGARHNTFMQLSMKAHVVAAHPMSTCGVRTWKSQHSTWEFPHG